MTSTPKSRTDDDRLEQILADYLHAVEQGLPANQLELIQRHPEHAEELQAFFTNRAAIERIAEPLKGPAIEATVGLTLADDDLRQAVLRVRYFGDYELLEELGRGGMGVVYKAKQVTLNRFVALKMILSGQLASADDIQRFREEAEAAANLDHPHIAPIYETGEHQGQHYFSMKLIEGETLRVALPRLRQSLPSGVQLLSQIARGVHHAHQRGVLHRDLKPANVLLDTEGTPYITDFGLAKRVEGGSDVTRTGAIVGTPSYMAPEQATGEKQLSTAVDIYSLGAILYELLTGVPPFQADSPVETLLQIAARDVIPPRKINPRADRDLETIALKCLEKDPARRYDSAAALADDLDRWQRSEPILARPATNLQRLGKWMHRKPAEAAFVGLMFLGAMAIFAGLSFYLWQLSDHYASSLVEQSRTLNALGDRQRAIDAVREAAGYRRTPEVRRAAIEAIVRPGTMLRQRIPFGRSAGYCFNHDATKIAVFGDIQTWSRGGEVRTGKVRVFQADSGAQLGELDWRVTENAREPAFSPTAPVMAVLQEPGTIEFWNYETGAITKSVTIDEKPLALLFDPDGRHLAVSAEEHTAIVVDVESGATFRPDRSSEFLCFNSPTSVLLKQGQRDDTSDPPLVVEWDLPRNSTRPVSKLGVDPLALSRDGKRIVVCEQHAGSYSVSVYSLPMDGQPALFTVKEKGPHFTARLNHDGRLLAIRDGSQQDLIAIWRIEQYLVLRTITIPGFDGSLEIGWEGYVGGYRSFDPLSPHAKRRGDFIGHGGRFAMLHERDGSKVQVWDVASDDYVVAAPKTRWFAWSDDGRKLMTDGSGAFQLYSNGQTFALDEKYEVVLGQTAGSPANGRIPTNAKLNATNGVVVDVRELVWPTTTMQIGTSAQPNETEFRADGELLNLDRSLYNVSTSVAGELALTFQSRPKFGDDVHFVGADQIWLVRNPPMAESTEKDAHAWELQQIEPQPRTVIIRWPGLPGAKSMGRPAFSPSGEQIVVPAYDSKLGNVFQVWELSAPDAPIAKWPAPKLNGAGDLGLCRFSPDGKTFLTTSFQNSDGLSLWDVAAKKRLWKITGVFVTQTHFTPDGKFICVPVSDSALVIDAQSGDIAAKVPLTGYALRTMTVSFDGRMIATNDSGQQILLLEVPSGKELARWEAHEETIAGLAFSPDGKFLVSSDNTGLRKIWNLADLRRELAELNLNW